MTRGWTGHIASKPPVLEAAADPGVQYALSKMSKAALADALAQAIAACNGRPDDPITIDDLRNEVVPTLIVRGDTIPSILR